MAEKDERPDDDWADVVAKWTFVSTLVLAILYVGTVFIFIMR